MSRTLTFLFITPSALALAVLSVLILPAQARPKASPLSEITVNTLDDENNADGDCSLREAIQASGKLICCNQSLTSVVLSKPEGAQRRVKLLDRPLFNC